MDRFNDPRIGICRDFGHANLMQYDQTRCLRMIGKRLKSTHVNDNRGRADDHMTPFNGDVRWEDIMPLFREIGYEGDFVYEIHGQTRRLPEELKDTEAARSFAVGEYLLMMENT